MQKQRIIGNTLKYTAIPVKETIKENKTDNMKSKFKLIAASFLFITCIAWQLTSFAQSGSLDLTFDTDGTVTTAIGSGSDVGNGVAIQSDGKIVVAGYSGNGNDLDFAVIRYNSNGSLDTGFGSNGKVTTDIANDDDYGNSVAIQADGKIVVAGYGRISSNNDIVVVRYNTDGTLDLSFDSDGKVTTPIGTSSDYAFAVTIQTDGKIVVAGSSAAFVVVRYNTDGSLDSNFDFDGIVTSAIGNSSEGLSIALQLNGKIVVAGYRSLNAVVDAAVVRYNTDGSLDLTFDSDGIVTTDISGFIDRVYSVGVQPDGKIVVAGISLDSLNSNFLVMRYDTNGTLDPTFDTDGIVTIDVASYNESARSLAIQSDGKIVVTGLSTIGTTSFVVLLRYQTNGSLDNTFDADGIVTTTIGGSCKGQSIALQSDGKIVVAGYALIAGNLDFAVARYNNINITGVNTISNRAAGIRIYPNPFSKQTTLQSNRIFNDASLTVFNFLGQPVNEVTNIHGEMFTLYRNDLPAGVYFIRIMEDNEVVAIDKLVITDYMMNR